MKKCNCLNCGFTNTVHINDVKNDKLGDFILCVNCNSSFDVNITNKYIKLLVTSLN